MTKFEMRLEQLKQRAINEGQNGFSLHMAKLYGLTEKGLMAKAEKYGLKPALIDTWTNSKKGFVYSKERWFFI